MGTTSLDDRVTSMINLELEDLVPILGFVGYIRRRRKAREEIQVLDPFTKHNINVAYGHLLVYNAVTIGLVYEFVMYTTEILSK